jgi:hypothetical protein
LWQWGIFTGIKKDYQFSKNVKGNIQVMYNVSKYVQYENPYVDKINIRIGFEFPLREVKKPKD